MLLGVLAVIVSSLSFTFIDIVLKQISSDEHYLSSTIKRSLVSVTLLTFIFIVIKVTNNDALFIPNSISLKHLPIVVFLCFISANGLFFFMQGIRHTQLSNTVGFNKVSIVMAILINITFLHQTINSQKLISILVVLIGISLIEYNYYKNNNRLSKGFVYIILARFCWSVGFLFVPYIIEFGVLLFTFILEAVVLITNLLYYLLYSYKMQQKVNINFGINFKQILFIAVLGLIGDFGNSVAKLNIPIILLALIGLLNPIIILLFSKHYLREQLTIQQILGILLGVVGAFIYCL
jgi:drug/metabolite transporter (DMT)-like permease